jgi:hypothetical protein
MGGCTPCSQPLLVDPHCCAKHLAAGLSAARLQFHPHRSCRESVDKPMPKKKNIVVHNQVRSNTLRIHGTSRGPMVGV